MKPFFHTIVYPVLCVFLVACGQKDFSTLKEVGGEGFIFSSTITALVETGDSLLVGTSDGKISYFNINNGDHSELRNVLGRAIYDIQICGDYLYFAVQDGGVKRVRLDDINNRKPETFKIRDKQGEFSPYDILIADDGISYIGGIQEYQKLTRSLSNLYLGQLPTGSIVSFRKKVVT